MPFPIRVLLGCLEAISPEVGSGGYYTLATLGQLAQSLSRLAFAAPGGQLIVAEGGEQARAWFDLALGALPPHVPRLTLPTAPGSGFALIGLGADLGFGLVAIPTDSRQIDDSSGLYDARWSLDPAGVGALLAVVANALPAGVNSAAPRLRPPAVAEALRLSADLLDFAARQHLTLAVTNKALNDRLRNHEDQTRMVVHDLRAPLHTLLISIRAVQHQRFDPEGQHELLDVANDSANYLLNLTETILDSARLETNGWALKRQPMALHTLVQAVCAPFERAARPNQARLFHKLTDDLPLVWLDRELMERVLTNLVSNAIKFTPAQGEIVVRAQVLHDGHTVELSVSDTGQGIAHEVQAHIFERFYQAREGDRRHGTGLGLYFCRLAIEAHGGTIAVTSAVGQGSTFSIQMPIRNVEA